MKKLFAIIFVLIFTATASAATKFVRSGAVGARTGEDWTNAYTALPSTLTRGETYYIADGSYSSYNFNAADLAKTYITIKKATVEDHGTSIGWNNSYGDDQAIFTGTSTISTNYWIIDGNRDCSDITNCTRGFQFYATSGTRILSLAGFKTGLELKSIEIKGGGTNELRGLYVCCEYPITDVLISNVEIHGCGNDALNMSNTNDITIEYTYIHGPGVLPAGSGAHPDALELLGSPLTNIQDSKNTLRYSRIHFNGQQMWFGAGKDLNISSGAWDIHGNVFIGRCDSTPWPSCTAIKSRTEISIGPLNVYNNTFACQYNIFSTGEMTGDFKNNIFYNSWSKSAKMGSGFKKATHDYNYFDSYMGSIYSEANGKAGGNPFVGLTGNNFKLKGATPAGANTAFTTDKLGNTRGADGIWDRGAYEYGSNASELIEPPAGVRINSN